MTSDNIRILKVEKARNTYIVTTTEDEFKIDEDTLIKHVIIKDREFTKTEFKNILNDIEFNKLFNKTLKYLGYGERTEYEIRKYLDKATNSEKVIKKLKRLGYIDDIQYANKYLDYCFRTNKGPYYCRNKLGEKGVDNKIIDNVIEKYTSVMQSEALTNIINKELKNNNKIPALAQKRRLINKLLRNGFSGENVYEIINKANFVDNSDDTLKVDYQKQLDKLAKKELSDYEKKQRIIAYLLNKGYDYKKINEIIE